MIFSGEPAIILWHGGLAQLVRAPASHAGGRWFESISLHQEEPLLGSGSFLAWYSDKWTRKAAPGGMPQPPWLLPQQKRIHSSPSKQTKPNPVTDWCRVRFCLYSQIASAGVQLALAICEIFFSILCSGNTPVSLAADTGQGIRTHNRGLCWETHHFGYSPLMRPPVGGAVRCISRSEERLFSTQRGRIHHL